jgi:O-antigen ligase
MFVNEPILLIFGAVLFLYFIAISLKFPIIPAAIYPFTFLNFTQTTLAVNGISPSKYIGLILIFVGMICLFKEIQSKTPRNYSLLGLFCLMMLFPTWIITRFLVEGSDMNLAFTFMLNALTTFSIVVIVNTERRKKIMEINLGATFAILSFGMIAADYLPSLLLLRSLQQGEYSRSIGLVNDPNYGGAFIAIGFAYFFSKVVFFYEIKQMKLFYLSLGLIAISIFSLFLTVSRAAILSIVVCLLMAAFYGKVRFRHMAWLLPSMAILFILSHNFPDIINAIAYRISITRVDPSNVARLEFFRAGMSVIRNNILWGVGDFTGYHNAFLDVAVFGGVIGLGLFLSIILVIFKMNARIMALSEGNFRDMARFVILGLIVALFNGLFIGIETERIVWFLFGWGMINFILLRKAQQDVIPTAGNHLKSRAWTKDERVVI